MRKKNFIKKAGPNSPPTRWKKLIVVAAVLLCLYLISTLLLGEMGLIKYYRMQDQHAMLTEGIAKLKLDNVRLRKEVSLLKNDAAYLERVARDKLGLARPGEIVYYYDDTSEQIQSPKLK